MADLVITAASVVPGANATFSNKNAGATITAGQVVYADTNSLWQLSKANGTAAQKVVAGIALANAALNQPLIVQTGGQITIGATVVAGTGVYFLSGTNAGGIAPFADLTTGWYVWLLGIALSTTVIKLQLFDSGAQL